MLMWWAKYPRNIGPTKFAPPHLGLITCLLPQNFIDSNGDNDLPSLFLIFHWNTICPHLSNNFPLPIMDGKELTLRQETLFISLIQMHTMTSPLSLPHFPLKYNCTQLSNIFPFSIWLAGWQWGHFETGDSFHFKNKIN